MTRTIKTLALCSMLLLLGSVVEAGSAADVFSRKFDEFYGVNWEGAAARLDNFALQMGNEPNAVGIVFVYGGQRRRPGEAKAWSACIRDYLVNRRGIDANRVVMVRGGYMQRVTVELWLGPDGTHIPKATPEIKPRNVRFSGRPIKAWRPLCRI